MFGAGTACVVCPIERILYEDTELFIPTMENGPEIASRCFQEISDIQVNFLSKAHFFRDFYLHLNTADNSSMKLRCCSSSETWLQKVNFPHPGVDYYPTF